MNLDETFRWMDGVAVPSGYPNWLPGNPNQGNQDYMGMTRTDGRWYDGWAITTYNYVCEAGLI